MTRVKKNPWSLWLVATVGSFAVLEGRALRVRDVPTLSESLARWSGVCPKRRHGDVAPILFLTFWTWLTVHVVRWEGGDK